MPSISPVSAWRRLAAATAYCLEIHAHQRRKGTSIPYCSHLLAVASLVLEASGDEELAIAGLLHDSIEDVGAEQEPLIAQKFGDRVARIVRGCTDADIFPKPPWRARKQTYLDHLQTVDSDVLIVSCADKLHNARAIVADLRMLGLSLFDRFNGGREGTIWYYRTLAETFARRLPGGLSRELTEAVRQMEQLTDEAVLAVDPINPATVT